MRGKILINFYFKKIWNGKTDDLYIWLYLCLYNWTAQKMKFSIKDFISKCDHIRRKLQIWSPLLKKSLMNNFIFAQCWIRIPILSFFQIQICCKTAFFFFLFHDGSSYHIETSPLILRANELLYERDLRHERGNVYIKWTSIKFYHLFIYFYFTFCDIIKKWKSANFIGEKF